MPIVIHPTRHSPPYPIWSGYSSQEESLEVEQYRALPTRPAMRRVWTPPRACPGTVQIVVAPMVAPPSRGHSHGSRRAEGIEILGGALPCVRSGLLRANPAMTAQSLRSVARRRQRVARAEWHCSFKTLVATSEAVAVSAALEEHGLESGEDEPFRRSIEAGCSPSREQAGGAVPEDEASRVEPQMPVDKESSEVAEGTDRRAARQPLLTARGRAHLARAFVGASRLWCWLRKRCPGHCLTRPAAARLALAFLAALALVRRRFDVRCRGHRRRCDALRRCQRDEQHGRESHAAKLADLVFTHLASHAPPTWRRTGKRC